MLTFVKLGGSLITDKRVESSFRPDVMARIATEIASAWSDGGAMQLVIGHGSGSFGHVPAKRYNTMMGVHTPEQWQGFADVAEVASQLNMLVLGELRRAGLPALRLQPSASAVAEDGKIMQMALDPVRRAYEHDLIPLVCGDVAFDTVRGGTIISTETVFTYLAHNLPVQHILLVGEVEGVYDDQKRVIPEITPQNLPAISGMLGESAGTDVTGGMLTKVSDMVALAQQIPGLSVRIIDGTQPDILRSALRGTGQFGTLIHAG